MTISSNEYGGTGAELVPGTLRGYREWQGIGGGLLAAISMTYVWESSEVTADCLRQLSLHYSVMGTGELVRNVIDDRRTTEHQVPAQNCSCGIYAKHRPSMYDGMNYIPGVIEGWGRVQLGREGFRAEHARIVALAMPHRILGAEYAEFMRIVGERYKSVQFYPSSRAMQEAFPPIDVSALIPKPPEPKVDSDDFWSRVRFHP